MLGNLTKGLLAVDPKLFIAYVHLLDVDDIFGYSPCSLMRDLGLPYPSIGVVLLSLDANQPPFNHSDSLALLD